MSLKELLARQRVRVGVAVASKGALLHEIAALLAPDADASVRGAIVAALERREALGSTGLGNGVALPHARLAPPFDAIAAFLRLDPAVDFGAPDGKLVDLVLALVVPENETTQYFSLLAQTAELLSDPQFVSDLRAAKDALQLYESLQHLATPAHSA